MHNSDLKIIKEIDRYIIPLNIIQSILTAILPYIDLVISAYIIDSIIVKDFEKMGFLIFIMLFSNFIISILINLLNSVNSYRADKLEKNILSLINKKAMEIDYEIIEDPETLQKISDAKYTMEHTGGYNAFIIYYRQILELSIKIVTSVVMVIGLCFKMPTSDNILLNKLSSPLFVLVLFISMTLLNMLFTKKIGEKTNSISHEAYKEKMTVERNFNYYTDNIFLNYPFGKDIRIFNMRELLYNKYDEHLKGALEFYKRNYDDKFLVKNALNLLSNSIYMYFAYIITILKILSKSITIGQLSKYIGAVVIFNNSTVEFIRVAQRYKLQIEFIKTFNNFLELENKKSNSDLNIVEDIDIIEFHNVSFKYPNTENYILKNLSCKLSKDNKIAIVGRNGAGKSTFIKLLCRLYDPTEGYITVNNVDIREYNYEEYMKIFSVVFQDYKLLGLPLSENIATDKSFDDKKIINIMESIGLKNLLEKIKYNLNINLYKQDKKGIEISGGESQKIAIGRALYKNSKIIIMDEPTAALDPISEYEIYSNLNNLTKDKTTIFISHRMSSCKFCDDIIVLDNGNIAERGNHNKLINNNGIYESLYNAQAENYKAG